MTTTFAKTYFTAAGPVVDFRVNDGVRERSIVRMSEALDAAQFTPVKVTSYRQLCELVATAGVTFAGEDIAHESALAAAETARRAAGEARRHAAATAARSAGEGSP